MLSFYHRRQTTETKVCFSFQPSLLRLDVLFKVCHVNLHSFSYCWRRFPSSCHQTRVRNAFSSPFFLLPYFPKAFNYFLSQRNNGKMTDVHFHPHFNLQQLPSDGTHPFSSFCPFWQFFILHSWSLLTVFITVWLHVHPINPSNLITTAIS